MINRQSALLFSGVGAAFGAALSASSAVFAADIKPAVIYDLGGKFDKSFNEGVYNGALKFKKDTGIDFRDLEIQNDAQREQVLRKFAKDGFSPIMTVGFAWATALDKVADEFPDTKFGIIDMVVDKPNVQSMLFKAQEGSFLVGVIAAKTSKTGKVGFVGGMDIPLISQFRMRLRPGRQIRRRQGRSVRQHDGHDAGGLERSGQGRRTRQVADRPRRRHRLRRRRRDRPGRAQGRRGRRQARHRRRFRPERSVPRQGADLDAEARRRRDLQFLHGRPRTATGSPASTSFGLKEGGVDFAVDDINKALMTPRREGGRRRGQGRHRLRQDPGSRLYGRQQVPGLSRRA